MTTFAAAQVGREEMERAQPASDYEFRAGPLDRVAELSRRVLLALRNGFHPEIGSLGNLWAVRGGFPPALLAHARDWRRADMVAALERNHIPALTGRSQTFSTAQGNPVRAIFSAAPLSLQKPQVDTFAFYQSELWRAIRDALIDCGVSKDVAENKLWGSHPIGESRLYVELGTGQKTSFYLPHDAIAFVVTQPVEMRRAWCSALAANIVAQLGLTRTATDSPWSCGCSHAAARECDVKEVPLGIGGGGCQMIRVCTVCKRERP